MKISKGRIYRPKKSKYLYLDLSVNKKRIQKSLETTDKKEAQRLLEEIKAGFLNGTITIKEETQNTNTFEYYSKVYLDMLSLKPSTTRNRIYAVKVINKTFGHKDITEIKTSEIKKYLSVYNRSRYLELLGVLKNIFNEAIDDEVIEKNPCTNIKAPRNINKEELHPFSVDEVDLILSNTSGWFKCFLATGFFSGMRTGEMFALKWQNVDFENKKIYVNATRGTYKEGTTKTGKSRYVPLFDNLVPFLKEQKMRTGLKEYVFYTDNGKHLHTGNIATFIWKPLLRRLNIPYRSIYHTRHTFATTMINSNKFTLNQIASMLGHKNINMLIQHYNKFIKQEIDQINTEIDVFCVNFCDTIAKSS